MGTNLPVGLDQGLRALLFSEVRVYNASDKMIRGRMNGQDFFFAPGEETFVGDIKDYPRDQKGQRQMDRDPILAVRSTDVVAHLLRDYGLLDQGLTVLTGNVDVDEKAKQDAYWRYVRSRVAHAKSRQTWWVRTCEHNKATGGVPLVMPDDIQEEIEFLRKHENEVLTSNRKRFWCTIDYQQFDKEADALAYVNATYPERIQLEGVDAKKYIFDSQAQQQDMDASFQKRQQLKAARNAESGLQEPQPLMNVPSGRLMEGDHPVDSLALRAEKVVEKAEELGMSGQIKKDELKALLKRDQKTIELLEQRLAETQVKREAVPAG